MKHFLFVSVAVGIFSGTSLKTQAQTSVNFLRSELQNPSGATIKFIEGIEFNQDVIASSENIKTAAIPVEPVKADFADATKTSIHTAIEKCEPLQFKYAMLTNREVELISNFSLYSFIDEWWATRYRFGGTTKKGIDCSAYTGTLLREVFGLAVPRTARAQYGICEKISREDLQEGDLVFFNTRGGVSHVGVYLGNNYFTHSSCSHGVTISSLDENYYSKRFISGGRVIQ